MILFKEKCSYILQVHCSKKYNCRMMQIKLNKFFTHKLTFLNRKLFLIQIIIRYSNDINAYFFLFLNDYFDNEKILRSLAKKFLQDKCFRYSFSII